MTSPLSRQKSVPAQDDAAPFSRQHRAMATTFSATSQATGQTGKQQHGRLDRRWFLLQRAQPAMTGLIDGSLSTLAPIFAVAFATHQPHDAFVAGLATAIGAGVSMAFSEGLSDTGDVTERGRPVVRGVITGAGTFLGGILHTLPFLIPQYRSAVLLAIAVIALELLALAWIRRRFFGTAFLSSLISVTLGGVIIVTVSATLGAFR
jgi:erythrin-vacuolar iron transport family protein